MSKSSDPIDAKLDGWLADWPAPERDDGAWEDFDGKLAERTAESTVGQGEEAWFEAPLPAEPGEGEESNAVFDAGGASMSEPESDKPKKKSLKDFAQRVSVTPPGPSGATETPAPKANETPMPTSGPRGSSPSLRASSESLVARPPEARDSDSGIVDLNAVRKSAASIPDTGAQPAQEGLFDDDEKAAAPAAAPRKKGSALPIIGGGLVAVLALAAAAVLVIRNPSQADMAASEAPAAPLTASVAANAGPEKAPAPRAMASTGGLSPESLSLATAEPPEEPGEGSPEEPAAARADEEPDEAKAKAAKSVKDEEKKDEPSEPTDPNDLAGAMATAVGASGDKKDDDAKKAAADSVDPGSIPESPSQGAIQGAIGSVKGAAKGCVAGLDGPSRAAITFSSNGTVSSVSVSGAAAGKPAAGCIQSALKRARVGPFKRSSFTVGVTIRP